MDEIDLGPIIKKAKNGDKEAFAALIEAYNKEMYRYIYRLTGNHADTDDLLQDVFLNVFRNLASFRDGSSFRSWIYTVARNRFLNFRRKARYEQLLLEAVDPLESGNLVSEQFSEEIFEEITNAVNALPDEQKQVVILFIMQDLSHREVAEAVGSTEETVRWRLYEARKKLRKKLNYLLKDR